MSRRFDKALETATDLTLVEPYWEGILECVDLIRGSDVAVKPALQAIQKRYHNENPHVAHHALLVLEACVKNCGSKFHTEIATREFMDDLKNIVIEGAPDKVKTKILELIQCWASAFEKSPQYKIVCDTHSFLKMYGFEFPRLKEADAMFMAECPPDWADGDSCFRCRVEFGVFTRKHHCRSCGQIFCDRCSNRQMLLPQFGIEKKVRVCETCYTKSNDADMKKFVEKITQNGQRGADGPASTTDEEKRQRELKEKEEEELQLALALSMSEAESKEKNRGMYHHFSSNNVASTPSNGPTEPAKVNGSNPDYSYVYRGVATESSAPVGADEEDDIDPALSRYLDKRYWEQRQAARDAETANTAPGIKATAPPPSEMSFSSSGDPTINDYASYALQNNGTQQPSVLAASNGTNGYSVPVVEQKMAALGIESSNEIEQTLVFCKSLQEQVEIMDNRMRSNAMRGRSVINDSAIHSLFTQLTNKHAEVLTRMNKLDKDREYYEGLQDHLGYIQEARKALVELRDEHAKQRQERLREEARLRAQQMQSKLEQIRQKKYESLLEQRHMALQRLQEEELRIQQNRGQVPQVPVSQQPQYVQGVQQPYPPQMMPPQSVGMVPILEQVPQESAAPVMHPQMVPQGSVAQPMAPQVSQMQHYQIPQQHPQMQYQQSVPPQMPPQQHYSSQPVSQPYVNPGQYPAPASQYQQYAQANQPNMPSHLPPDQPISHQQPSNSDDAPLIQFD